MDSGRPDSAPGIDSNLKLNIETISCCPDGVLCISVKRSSGKRRWFKWNKPQKNADECVWTSDEEDANSAPGPTKEIGKAWAPDGKKKGKPFRWNRSQKGTVECGWDSDAVSDLTECRIPVEPPRAKKKLKWASDPKSAHERVRTSDADKLKQIERAVGVSGLEQERVRRRGKWNKPQKDATESAWDSDTILDD